MFETFPQNAANHTPLSPLSFIKRAALMFPDHPAVIYGKRRYTWAETYKRTVQLATAITNHGLGKGDTVAILSANTPEMVEAHFGVAMAGAVLNSINTRLEPETIAYILEHGEAKMLIVDAELCPQAAQALDICHKNIPEKITIIDIKDTQNCANPKTLGSTDYETFIANEPDFNWSLPADEWQAMTLNYTSGTSGRPKGVVYHHRGGYLMAIGTIADWEIPRHPIYLAIVPLFHCNGWGHSWAMAAVAGTIICTRVVSADAIYTAIDTHKVTHFAGAPIVLSMLLNAPASEKRAISHKIKVFTAGAPPPSAILQGIEAMGFDVTQVYGLTETYGHTVICTERVEWADLDDSARADMKARQGAAMVMMEGLRVVDENGVDVVADGKTIGEIVLRGNCVMKGYLKAEAATAEAFAGGWYHTGDLAVMHDYGYAQIMDRAKDIIISGGENISSVEVEGVLHRHDSVALACVVAMADDKWGEVPCAFIELKDGAVADEAGLIAHCRAHLAGFKCPKSVRFCELPKTATGKIQKFVLRDSLKND